MILGQKLDRLFSKLSFLSGGDGLGGFGGGPGSSATGGEELF